jgi:nitrite reductase/ring-hydroxylating ferredoxin subunit
MQSDTGGKRVSRVQRFFKPRGGSASRLAVDMTWHVAIAAGSITDGEMVGLQIDDREIAICRIGEQYHAVNNICTHEYTFLSDGYFEDGCIECPLHQARFDVLTGQPDGPPPTEPIRVYPVKIEAGQVLVDLGELSTPDMDRF